MSQVNPIPEKDIGSYLEFLFRIITVLVKKRNKLYLRK